MIIEAGPMHITGEITAGTISVIVTILSVAVTWWLKNDRQNTRWNMTMMQMQKDIGANREENKVEVAEIRAEMKTTSAALNQIQIQLAAINAQNNMGILVRELPSELAKVLQHRFKQDAS